LDGKAFYRNLSSPGLLSALSWLREIVPALRNGAPLQFRDWQPASGFERTADGTPVIAVTGLKTEARIAAGPRVLAVSGGANAFGLARSLEAAVAKNAAAIISFGISGGLAPGLRPGTRLVARSVITEDGTRYHSDAAWSERLSGALGGVPVADIAGVDLPVAGHAEKRTLHLRTGALAVDTESHIAARIAADYKLPFAAFRVVADPAHRQLPHAALVALKPDGSLALGAIARSLWQDPGQLPLLVKTARDARAAFTALFYGRQMLAGALGFTDFGELLLDVPAEDVIGGPLPV
jgi:adenosylhomocysteine nucleosidase